MKGWRSVSCKENCEIIYRRNLRREILKKHILSMILKRMTQTTEISINSFIKITQLVMYIEIFIYIILLFSIVLAATFCVPLVLGHNPVCRFLIRFLQHHPERCHQFTHHHHQDNLKVKVHFPAFFFCKNCI